jgi:regulator of CtrA degradation
MSDKSVRESGPVLLKERLANSQAFQNLFKDGMALVEETAAYLDGPGRRESKELSRTAALIYATESMRLTTRLMQLASWLLLHRAVREGEMSLAQVNQEKTKVKLSVTQPIDPESMKLLPDTLKELIERALRLTEQVRRLDATMHGPDEVAVPKHNPVESQLGLLKAAFERTS